MLTPAGAYAQTGHNESPRAAAVSASGARLVVVEARAGTLRIEGKAALTEVRARGTAYAPRKGMLDDIKLEAKRDGNIVRVIVEIPEMSFHMFDSSPRLDLEIEVPNTIALQIHDTSGETEIRGVAAVELEDGSGGIEIRDVTGALRVEDGSGSILIENVRGNVSVRDGSGEIDVTDVTGALTVEADGSGEIVARRVSGTVHVKRDGSGSIRVVDVGGDLVVDRDGSGGVTHRSVKGAVRVP
jgi:DUF4097 and DUF4098 domain-containing protein YvlB